VIRTLWSGRQVDNQVPTSSNPTQAPTPSSSTPPNSVDKSVEQVHKPTTPFSNRLRNNNNTQMEKICEIFNQVKINVPLLDAIQQVSIYAKFFKDMCTKRKTNVPKKVFQATKSLILVSYCPIRSPSSTRILIVLLSLAQ